MQKPREIPARQQVHGWIKYYIKLRKISGVAPQASRQASVRTPNQNSYLKFEFRTFIWHESWRSISEWIQNRTIQLLRWIKDQMIILSETYYRVLHFWIIFQSQLSKHIRGQILDCLVSNLSKILDFNLPFLPQFFKFKRQYQKTDNSKLRNYFSPYLDAE